MTSLHPPNLTGAISAAKKRVIIPLVLFMGTGAKDSTCWCHGLGDGLRLQEHLSAPVFGLAGARRLRPGRLGTGIHTANEQQMKVENIYAEHMQKCRRVLLFGE